MAAPPTLSTLPPEIIGMIANVARHGAFGDDGRDLMGPSAQATRQTLTTLRSVDRRLYRAIQSDWEQYLYIDLTQPSTIAFFDKALRQPPLAAAIRAVQISTLTEAAAVGTLQEWGQALGEDRRLIDNLKKLSWLARRLSVPNPPRTRLGMHLGVASETDPNIQPWQVRVETLCLLAFRYFPNLETLRIAYKGAVSDELLDRILAECPNPRLRTLHFHAGIGRAWADIHPIQFWALWQLPNLRCIWLDRVTFSDNLSFHPHGHSPITELRAHFKGDWEHMEGAIYSTCPHLTTVTLIDEGDTFVDWSSLAEALCRRHATLETLRIISSEPWPGAGAPLREPHPYSPSRPNWAARLARLTRLEIPIAALDPRFSAASLASLLPPALASLQVFCPGPEWTAAIRSLSGAPNLPTTLRSVQVDTTVADYDAYVAVGDSFQGTGITYSVAILVWD